MSSHLHWIVLPESADALRNATRYVFGQLAKMLNRIWGRTRGKVFADRYHSTIGSSVRQAWNMVNYVLRNPVSAHCHGADSTVDRFLGINIEVLTGDRFLGSIFGPDSNALRCLVRQMTRAPVPYTPLMQRIQATLPGLGA